MAEYVRRTTSSSIDRLQDAPSLPPSQSLSSSEVVSSGIGRRRRQEDLLQDTARGTRCMARIRNAKDVSASENKVASAAAADSTTTQNAKLIVQRCTLQHNHGIP